MVTQGALQYKAIWEPLLYTSEFFAEARQRLNPGGVCLLWFPYAATADDFKTHLRTFRAAFVLPAAHPGREGPQVDRRADAALADASLTGAAAGNSR